MTILDNIIDAFKEYDECWRDETKTMSNRNGRIMVGVIDSAMALGIAGATILYYYTINSPRIMEFLNTPINKYS